MNTSLQCNYDGIMIQSFRYNVYLLLQSVQAVDHPYLVVYSRANSSQSESGIGTDNAEQTCGICHDPIEDPAV